MVFFPTVRQKLASWEKLTGTIPTIESDRTIATVSFHLKSAIQRKVEGKTANDGKNDIENDVVNDVVNDVENDVENDVVKLNQRQRIILERIKSNPMMSAKAISADIGVSHSTIQRDLKRMQGLGIIVHEGPDKGGVWRLR